MGREVGEKILVKLLSTTTDAASIYFQRGEDISLKGGVGQFAYIMMFELFKEMLYCYIYF